MRYIKSALILITCMAVLFSQSTMAGEPDQTQKLIEQIVVSYAAFGEKNEQQLSDLAALDPALGDKWNRIMDLWVAPVTVCEELPDGLPEDDTLCLVVLGFQLNPDGSMREELIERLNVALATSEKYPNARIVCTGGGTAAEDQTATEAGKMAEWLEEHGVDPSRLIVEDQSLTTAQNAIYTFDILTEKYPQVNQISIISSDYHIATGLLLFGAEAILRESDIEVDGNAAWNAREGSLSTMFQAGALIELSGDVETAFEIYYDTYDIHELPKLHEAEMKLFIGETEVPVTWEENASVEELRTLLPLTIEMSMYGGFEQVGPIGQSITSDDQKTMTDYGDVVLYSGDQIVVFYGTNSWAYTRLGHIDLSQEEMADLLGNGDVTITLIED